MTAPKALVIFRLSGVVFCDTAPNNPVYTMPDDMCCCDEVVRQ